MHMELCSTQHSRITLTVAGVRDNCTVGGIRKSFDNYFNAENLPFCPCLQLHVGGNYHLLLCLGSTYTYIYIYILH